MKTHTHHKGSALMTVLILTIVMGMMAGALLNYAMAERRLNRHALLLLQSQDAARAVLEYGTSQISVTYLATPESQLQTYLTANPTALNLYTARDSALFTTGSTAQDLNDYPVTTSFALYGSKLTTAGPFTFNKNDPRNFNDPLDGQTVSAQNEYLMAQATATDVNSNSVTDYAMQAIQLRYTSIFNYAIFYNVPMELAPSDQMDIYGPVFSNSPVYLNSSATASNSLVFHSTFNTASTFSAQPLDAGTGESGRPTNQNIYFPNQATPAVEVGILDPTLPTGIGTTTIALGTSVWVDSFLNETGAANISTNLPNETFSQAASYLWQGNVQDRNNVQPENPPGIAAAASTLGLTSAQAAQEFIETPTPINAASYNSVVEEQKFANLAGLYIVVTPNNSATATGGASVVAFYGSGQNALKYLYVNPTAATPVKNTAAQRLAWLNIAANAATVLFTSTGTVTPNSATGSNTLAGIVNTSRLFYDPREAALLNAVDIDVGALAQAIGTGQGTTYKNTTLTIGSKSSGTLWDIDATTPTDNEQPWNGVVYVDVETDTYGDYLCLLPTGTTGVSAATYYGTPSVWGATGWKSTSDVNGYAGPTPIVGTGTETVVRLVDGGNTGLGLTPNAALPSRPSTANNSTAGFSLTTNAPVYVVGNYNADGTLPGEPSPSNENVMDFDSTLSPLPTGTDPITGNTITIGTTSTINEVPAMVAGDAIDILSTAWWTGGLGGKPNGDGDETTPTGTFANANEPNANNTEIAGGFITGNVATTLAGGYNYSGGVENYVRLEENWGTAILRFRGSMVGLYNSAVATGQWPGTGSKTYSAPKDREVGYDNLFGIARDFPPGAPVVVSLRRMNYEDITAATFNANLANTNYSFTLQH
jgi:hypothetical protein